MVLVPSGNDHATQSTPSYWPSALRYYVKVSFLQSAIIWAPALAISALYGCWAGISSRSWSVVWNVLWSGCSFGAFLGGGFFAFVFAVALGDDLFRNRKRRERTLAWRPLLVWKVLLYAGGTMFGAFGVLSYRQEGSFGLSAFFIAFAVGSVVAARHCLKDC